MAKQIRVTRRAARLGKVGVNTLGNPRAPLQAWRQLKAGARNGAMDMQQLERLVFGTDDPRQRLRMRRFFMACASYAMWFVMALVVDALGLLHASTLQAVSAFLIVTASQVVFYFLFRTGFNQRAAEPSLTIPQMLVALAYALVLTAWTREARGLVIAVYMVTLLFGVFGLTRRQYTVMAIISFLAYAALVLGELWLQPDKMPANLQWVSLLILAGLLGWTVFFGGYVSNLRYRLQRQNDDMRIAMERIQVLAEQDDLTGLYNRRYIVEALKNLKARADRDGKTFSLCIIDLDRFKEVNDIYGHMVGDRVLVRFAQRARDMLRGMDLIGVQDREDTTLGRFGGEEFIIVLPATALEGAWQCAERLRVSMAETAVRTEPMVTLSAGVAEYVLGEAIENLLRRADRALYEAKHSGRNRVVGANI